MCGRIADSRSTPKQMRVGWMPVMEHAPKSDNGPKGGVEGAMTSELAYPFMTGAETTSFPYIPLLNPIAL